MTDGGTMREEPAVLPPVGDEAAAEALLASFREANGTGGDEAVLRSIFRAAVTVGHDLWPRQIAELLPGRDVLDVGCGNTFYGAVMRALGARSYFGTEPRLDLDRTRFRSRREKRWVTLDVSLRTVVGAMPAIAYDAPAGAPAGEAFDLAVMHTVTEHLLDIEGVFAATAAMLRPGGELWFLHDNFAAWAGHHMSPHSPRAIDPADPDQALYMDWRHLSFEPPPDHPFVTNLNRIRIDELRAVTERAFEVLSWTLVPDERRVRARLTPEIEAGLPGYGREELLTRHVICHARRR